MVKGALLAVLFSATAHTAHAGKGPVIQTDDGPVQGTHDLLTAVTTYHAIPFAAPPTRDLRWKKPTRPAPWTVPVYSKIAGHQCPQLDLIKLEHLGQEDCLFASVFVPKACEKAGAQCAVMQWIYGGAWVLGSDTEFGVYDGTTLAEKHGVIVVAANYRLDSLGWLALPELKAADEGADGSYGNYGLHDQRAALRWTQRNVAAFGGDPNRVTIFGESAGGFSVCQHIGSPASDGLFSHAIMESGDCDGPWLIADGADAQRFGDAYATALGCPPDADAADADADADGSGSGSGAARLVCLRQLPLKDVLLPYADWFCKLHTDKDPWCNKTATMAGQQQQGALVAAAAAAAPTPPGPPSRPWPSPVPPFAPIAGFIAVIDGSPGGLPNTPLHEINAGRVARSPTGEPISVIMGTNTDEFALFIVGIGLVIPGASLPITDAVLNATAAHIIEYHDGWNTTTAQQYLAQYPLAKYKTHANRLVAAGTDFVFRCGTRTAVRALTRQNVSTYLYNFDFHGLAYSDPSSEKCQLDGQVGCGVFHASELPYVFGDTKVAFGLPAGKRVSEAVMKYWTNMATTGTPNSADVVVQWPIYREAEDRNIRLADPVTVEAGYGKFNCDFWDSLPRQTAYPSR
jgi:carboxylesterase type B